MSNTNRTKGHNYERTIAIRMRELGFNHCVTARQQNRRLDDAKIDLSFTPPLAIQCKYAQNAPHAHKLLAEMQKACNELPEVKGCYPVIYHKRKLMGETVTMRAEDFEEIVRVLKHEKIWT